MGFRSFLKFETKVKFLMDYMMQLTFLIHKYNTYYEIANKLKNNRLNSFGTSLLFFLN